MDNQSTGTNATEGQSAVNGGVSPTNPSNGLAITALVLGIVALFLGWIPFLGLLLGVAAVVFGVLGLKKNSNKGMSIAGLATGAVGALWGLIVTFFLVLALIVGAGAANGVVDQYNQQNKESEALVQAKKDFAKGETAVFNDFELKVNEIQRNYSTGNPYTEAEEGKEYIVVNVTVKNITDEPVYVNAFDLSLNEAGTAKGEAIVLGVTDKFDGGELSPGASTSGNLSYEVTKGATDLKLQYTTTIIGGENNGEKLVYTLAL